MSENRGRAVVVGLGVGKQHAEFLRARGMIVETVDRSKEADFTEFDASLFSGALCVVASHDQDHFYHVKAAWLAGMDVFCEKPICIAPGHLKELVDLVRSRPRQRFACNFPIRAFFPKIKCKPPIVNAFYNYGRLSKLSGWRSAFPYSIVLGGGIHMIDLVMSSLKERIKTVVAQGSNPNKLQSTPRTLVSALCRTETGIIVNLVCDFTYEGVHEHRVEWRQGRDWIAWHNQTSAPKTWCLERFLKGEYSETGFDAHCVAFAIEQSLSENREVAVRYL